MSSCLLPIRIQWICTVVRRRQLVCLCSQAASSGYLLSVACHVSLSDVWLSGVCVTVTLPGGSGLLCGVAAQLHVWYDWRRPSRPLSLLVTFGVLERGVSCGFPC